MNGVIGMTQLLQGTALDGEQREFVDVIQASADALLTIINDILDFSKIEAGRLDIETIDFDVAKTVAQTADLLAARAAEKGLEFVCDVENGLPRQLRGDPGRLRQVLLNLAGNAIKFTQHGEVAIAVREQSRDGRRLLLEFRVSDTGIGIPADKLPYLFKPFSQVDSSTTRHFGGTGLGLSISRRLVEMMGGEIGVDSVAGQGSTFRFTVAVELADGTAAPAVLPEHDIAGCHVLVVDDNETNRRVLMTMLRSWGCRSAEAEGAAAALRLLKQAVVAEDPFEIALLDMNMPEQDGETLGRLIRDDPQLSAVRRVMLTSAALRGDAARMRAAGFAAYLTKPLKEDHIRRCLAALRRGEEDESVQGGGEPPAIITRHILDETQPTVGADVLLVEDNLVNQKVALAMLGKHGHRVTVAANGAEALERLAAADYDLVLMDCQMPVMDGFEATRRIRGGAARNPRIPVVAMTANAMEGDREACLQAGMDDYLAKPIGAAQLAAAIARFLGQPHPSAQAEAPLPAAEDEGIFSAARMLEHFGDDEGIARMMLTELQQDLPERIDSLAAALAAADAATARREAHTIKGLAAGAGAAMLAETALRIEKLCRERAEPAAAQAGIVAMRTAFDRTVPLWRGYLDS